MNKHASVPIVADSDMPAIAQILQPGELAKLFGEKPGEKRTLVSAEFDPALPLVVEIRLTGATSHSRPILRRFLKLAKQGEQREPKKKT